MHSPRCPNRTVFQERGAVALRTSLAVRERRCPRHRRPRPVQRRSTTRSVTATDDALLAELAPASRRRAAPRGQPPRASAATSSGSYCGTARTPKRRSGGIRGVLEREFQGGRPVAVRRLEHRLTLLAAEGHDDVDELLRHAGGSRCTREGAPRRRAGVRAVARPIRRVEPLAREASSARDRRRAAGAALPTEARWTNLKVDALEALVRCSTRRSALGARTASCHSPSSPDLIDRLTEWVVHRRAR